jgi:hypothetical protein
MLPFYEFLGLARTLSVSPAIGGRHSDLGRSGSCLLKDLLIPWWKLIGIALVYDLCALSLVRERIGRMPLLCVLQTLQTLHGHLNMSGRSKIDW